MLKAYPYVSNENDSPESLAQALKVAIGLVAVARKWCTWESVKRMLGFHRLAGVMRRLRMRVMAASNLLSNGVQNWL